MVTGTGPDDPGIGMFVNLEGDVTRSTLEFERYPDELVVDGRGVDAEPFEQTGTDENGYVLASMARWQGERMTRGLEIQRWDLDAGEDGHDKSWLPVPSSSEQVSFVAPQDEEAEDAQVVPRLGIRGLTNPGDIQFPEVVDRLRLRRFHMPRRHAKQYSTSSVSGTGRPSTRGGESHTEQSLSTPIESDESLTPEEWEETRNDEEYQFARRLGQFQCRIAVWSGRNVWWAVKNPMILRLEASLGVGSQELVSDRSRVIHTINSLRGREATTELEFIGLGYIRQYAGLVLFGSFMDNSLPEPSDMEMSVAEGALFEGALDPRAVLSIAPFLRQEVIESKQGIWIHGGVRDAAESYILQIEHRQAEDQSKTTSERMLHFLKRFLAAWRRKKGFGSIADESEVFQSVDAALLVVLLHLDKSSPLGPARPGSIRSELNDLVDHGVECFDRAASLLEEHQRLYMLSRLYQSRKMSSRVLATWRRIVEGEPDSGGEFTDGEQEVRKYLMVIGNSSLVQEYGVWLAARNPKLGVQVFAEDRSRVKFEPTRVVAILRQGAPGAVKDYLEYLVFGKNHTGYVNELIAYYLDIVIQELETSESSRATLAQSYKTYRALRSPKPTYRQFITDNAIDEDWWHSRLRLLQLLGGSHQSASQYDVAAIRARIAPYLEELVPEVIILDGRQCHHEEAIRLLTHGLGDYDTAINYCLLGGSSIYHPVSGTMSHETLPTREEQAVLFGYLLAEFLRIGDVSDCIEQTSSLLERFGGWFDVGHVLSLIPDSWSVDLVSGFLVSALRRIVRERSETMVAKALSGAENLRVSAGLIERIQGAGPTIEADDS